MTTSTLIVVSGLPGVGKTTIAAVLAERLSAVHLSIDPVEDAMLRTGLPAGHDVGVAAYEAVRAMAELNLVNGTVVVDAVNDSEPARETWRSAARQHTSELTWVVLSCSDPAEHRRRLDGRSSRLTHVPAVTWALVQRRARDYAPWTYHHLAIDTAGRDVDEVVRLILADSATR